MKALIKIITAVLLTTTLAHANNPVEEPMIHPPQVIINPLHACEGDGLKITATEKSVPGVQQVTIDYVSRNGEVIEGRSSLVVEKITTVKGPHNLVVISGQSYVPIACNPMHPCPDMSKPFTLILEGGSATYITESAPADRRIKTTSRLKCEVLI